MGKKLFQTGQRTATTQGIEDHPEDNGTWIDGHLGRYHLIDHLNQANLVGRGLHKGQMLDWVRFDCRWHEIHTALQEGPWFISSPMTQPSHGWGRLCSTCTHGNCMDRQPKGCGM